MRKYIYDFDGSNFSIDFYRYCFLEMAKEMKHFHEIEFTILVEWFKYLENEPRTRLELIGNRQLFTEIFV
jgi:hypothetical protein